MPDPKRFPVSCHLDADADADTTTTTAAASPPTVVLGPTDDRCGPAGATVVVLHADPAPQPVVAIASVWSGPALARLRRESIERRHSLRESRHEAANQPTKAEMTGVSWHPPAYAPDRPSLLNRFVVHETGPGLSNGRNFGRHVRSLRRARGMTQEVLAERSSLSPDTIRRLEHGSFSPSLETLRKLCVGLDLMLSTLFESYELGDRNESRELVDLLATRTPRELILATRVLRALFDELDGIAAEAAAAEAERQP
ncbi:MAG: helix-turn-helix domain-containing protein [Enhygromyxa sp.]